MNRRKIKELAMAKSMPIDELYHELDFSKRQIGKRNHETILTDDFAYCVNFFACGLLSQKSKETTLPIFQSIAGEV